MTPPTTFLADVLQSLVDLLAHEYRGRFQPTYDSTVQIIGARPFEPAEEIRNAFDHISRSLDCARQAEVASLSDLPAGKTIATLREDALTNLEQARRHLVLGRLFCMIHQIVWQIDRMANDTSLRRAAQQGVVQQMQKRADALEETFRNMVIPMSLSNMRATIEEDTSQLELRVEEIVNLGNNFQLLYENARDVAEGR